MQMYRIVDPHTGEEVDTVDEDQTCHGRYNGEFCGGCGNCLLMQANHYGYKIKKVENNDN